MRYEQNCRGRKCRSIDSSGGKSWSKLYGTPTRDHIEIWNALPSTVVAASSSNVFKRMFDCVDLAKLCL